MNRRLVALFSIALMTALPACGTHTDNGATANPTPTPGNGPTVSIQASTTSGTAPLTVNFVATATNASGNVTWAWDFGDGASDTQQNPAHTFQQQGTFVVTAKGTDATNHFGTATITINVGARTAPSVTASADHTSGLAPLTVNFTSTVSGGTAPIQITWDFGDGETAAEANPSHVFQAAGSFSAKVTAKDATGAAASATVVIQVGSATSPVVAITANPTSGAAPLPVAFTSQVSGGNGTVTYAWDFGDGATATTANANHTYMANGNYTAKLTIHDQANKSAMATVAIVVADQSATMPDFQIANIDAQGTGLNDAYEPNDDINSSTYLGDYGSGNAVYTVSDGYLDTIDVTFSADIVNVGAATTTPFYVDFYQNNAVAPADGTYGDQYQDMPDGLGMNATQRVYFTVKDPTPGATTTTWIKADSLSEVDEADETNNYDGLNVTVFGDEDWFSVYETSGYALQIDLTNLPQDYDLELYDGAGNKVASSENAGTTAESITYTTTADDYYFIRVLGYNGARDSANPYTLTVQVP